MFWKSKGTTISLRNFLTFISLLSDKISSMAGWHSRSRSRHWSGNCLRCRNQSAQFTLSRQYHVDYQLGKKYLNFWKMKGTTISFWNFLIFISLLSDKISSMAGWHSRSRSRHWSGNCLRCRNQSTQFTLSRQYHVQSQGWKGTCWYLGKAKKCHIHLAAPLLHYWKQSKVCIGFSISAFISTRWDWKIRSEPFLTSQLNFRYICASTE